MGTRASTSEARDPTFEARARSHPHWHLYTAVRASATCPLALRIPHNIGLSVALQLHHHVHHAARSPHPTPPLLRPAYVLQDASVTRVRWLRLLRRLVVVLSPYAPCARRGAALWTLLLFTPTHRRLHREVYRAIAFVGACRRPRAKPGTIEKVCAIRVHNSSGPIGARSAPGEIFGLFVCCSVQRRRFRTDFPSPFGPPPYL